LVLSAIAAAFVPGIGTAAFAPVNALTAGASKVDCSKRESKDSTACKKKP